MLYYEKTQTFFRLHKKNCHQHNTPDQPKNAIHTVKHDGGGIMH